MSTRSVASTSPDIGLLVLCKCAFQMKKEKVKIRSYESKDLLNILEIERCSFREPWSQSTFEYVARLSKSHFLVAQEDNNVLGYIISNESNFEKIGRILNLAVEEKYRRQGIGSMLVQTTLKMFCNKKVSKVFLEVRRSNLSAIKVYSKFGFEVDKVLPEYYFGEDAYLMSKNMDDEK